MDEDLKNWLQFWRVIAICITALLLACIAGCEVSELSYITNGYSQVQKVGNEGTIWVHDHTSKK